MSPSTSTIRDVAHAAGVSIATVSRVLNGTARVSDEITSRVIAAVAAVDYWPNGAARSLPTRGQTHVIGVLLPDLYGEFYSEMIRGLDRAARSNHFQILLSSSHGEGEALMTAARSMPGRVDGLIVMAPDEGSRRAVERIARRFRVVLMNPAGEMDGCSSVSIANYEGARDVVRHLVAYGHRAIAIIGGPSGNHDAEERLRGYRAALREAGIQRIPSLELAGDFTEPSGYRAAAELLANPSRPTAVFAANDATAVGFMSALSAQGIRVPEDMAVAGFDDIMIAQYVTPALTTAHVNVQRLGERAVELLLSSREAVRETLPVPLVVRSSSGAEARTDHGQPAGQSRRNRRSEA